jgi:putative addiction module killer protein
MFEIQRTEEFRKWLDKLRDPLGKVQIARRIKRAEEKEHFGEYKDLGSDLFEMKFTTGPGYRLYLTQIAGKVYLLLGGGDKSSQASDIEKALAAIATLKGEEKK